MDEHRIFQKCAWRLIPFIMVLYVVNYIDRVNVGFAALTMNKDLDLSPAVFGFGAGIFFFGYMVFQVPANLILDKLGARRWVFWMLAIWGLISAGNAFMVGPYSYYTLRFILGVAEAGFFPGMLLYLTYWFPPSYRSRFIAIFMAAIPLSNIIGGPLSSAILEMDGIAGLRGWQWMFLLEGLPVTLLAFAVLKWLPDRPASAEWLTAEEKAVIAQRLKKEDRTEHGHLWSALIDPRIIAIGLVLLGNQVALYGIQLWLPQIIKEMGYSNFATGFVVAPVFIVGMVAMVYWGHRSDVKNERIWHVIIPLALAAASLIAASLTSSSFLILLALTIALVGTLAYNGPFFSLPSIFLAGTAAAGGIGFVNTIGSLGRFIGPYGVGVLRETYGGYGAAMAGMGVCMVMSTLIVVALGRMRGLKSESAHAEPAHRKEAAKPV